MLFILHKPITPLDIYTDSIVYYEGYSPDHSKDRLLPNGTIDLIIDLEDHPKHVYDNNNFNKMTSFKKCWLSGMRKEYITIESIHQSMIVISFKPGGAFPFFNFPLEEIKDKVIHLDEIWGSKFLSVRERILNTTMPAKRIKIIEDHLLQIIKFKTGRDSLIDFFVKKISNASDTCIIKNLQKESGYSHKHFIHLFKNRVGISPKYFFRINRFQKVLREIEVLEKINWTKLIYSCGYYDQSHFIKEFKNFSGLNPTEYLNSRGEHLNYIPLD